MTESILITGGAGFIGSHLGDELLRAGYAVRVLDSLVPQVHGADRERPLYLSPDIELIRGDVRDTEALARALQGVDAVFHLASLVGVGQSMYRIADYTEVNDLGTARLLEALAKRPVERLVVASSMSVYGEGLYADAQGRPHEGASRTLEQLRRADWEPRGDEGEKLVPLPTPEWKRPSLESIYALGKYQQEQSCLIAGRAYGMPTVGLRFFNIYGPRQALSNPYTGVLAIFASRYLNGKPPLVFEDGWQRRDFVSVHDVAKACRLALEAPGAAGQVLNVGSGRSYTVRQIADRIGKLLGKTVEPEITGEFRAGDIRHCYADVSRAREVLGYEPRIELTTGLEELAEWLSTQTARDRTGEARRELEQRGLTL